MNGVTCFFLFPVHSNIFLPIAIESIKSIIDVPIFMEDSFEGWAVFERVSSWTVHFVIDKFTVKNCPSVKVTYS